MDIKFFNYAVLGYIGLASYCLMQIGGQMFDINLNLVETIQPGCQEIQGAAKGMGLHHLTSIETELEWSAPNPFSLFGEGLIWLFGLAKVMLVATALVICLLNLSYRLLKRP